MKNLLVVLILLFTSYSFGQAMVVTDVTANQTLTTQLAKSAQQLNQLEKNYELLKSAEDKYKKINSIVTSVAKISSIIDLQKEAIENVNIVLNNSNLKGKSRTTLLNSLNQSMLSIGGSVETITNVLNEGFFNMSDKERLEMFEGERKKVLFQVGKTRGYANPYRK